MSKDAKSKVKYGNLDLETAVNRFGAVLYRYCAGILCDCHEAQDAVQETYIKALCHAGELSHGHKLGWVAVRIAYQSRHIIPTHHRITVQI